MNVKNQNVLIVIASQFQLDSAILQTLESDNIIVVDRRSISIMRYLCQIFNFYIATVLGRTHFDKTIVGDKRSLLNRLAHIISCDRKIVVSDGIGDVLYDYYYDDGAIIKTLKKAVFSWIDYHEFSQATFDFDISQKPRDNSIWVIGQSLSERGDMSYKDEIAIHRNIVRFFAKEVDVRYFLHPRDSSKKQTDLSNLYTNVIATSGLECFVKNAPSLPTQMVTFYSTAALNICQMGYRDIAFVELHNLSKAQMKVVARVHQLFKSLGFQQINV